MQSNSTTFKPDIKGVKIKKVVLNGSNYDVFCVRNDHRDKCCNKKMNIHDYRTVHIRSLKYNNRSVTLHIKKQRYVCPNCGKKITSSLEIIEKNCIISIEVKKEIKRKLTEMKSLTQISREENVSVSTVLRILEQIIITNKVYNLEEIYLDEFKGDANGEKYQLAIYDKNHRLVSILKDRKSSTLKAFLNKNKDIIKVVSIDMFMQFRNTILSTLHSNVSIVADKYHVIRQANWMIRDVRINLYNSDIKNKDLKKYWKLIAKNPTSYFTEKQINKLNELRNLNDRFDRAYTLRIEFFEIFNIRDSVEFSNRLDNLIEKLLLSEIKECIKLGNTLQNWNIEIKNIIKYNINNGFVEGYNNKIKVIKRIGYGIKKFDNLKKLIQLRIA